MTALLRNQVIVVKGDLLFVEKGIIVHGCNGQKKMGSGVAKLIKDKWPSAYDKYLHGPMANGTVSYEEVSDDLWVMNAITQQEYGNPGERRFTSYDAVVDCLEKVNKFAMLVEAQRGFKPAVHFPHRFASYRGGANWLIIQRCIEATIHPKFQVYIHFLMEVSRGQPYDYTVRMSPTPTTPADLTINGLRDSPIFAKPSK